MIVLFVDGFNSLVEGHLRIIDKPLWRPSIYRTVRTLIMEDRNDEPPAYTPMPRPLRTGFRHEHRYMLQDKSGRDWVAFKVRSRAVDPKHAPLFFEGDTIKGEVLLDFAKAQTLKGLTITVCNPLRLVALRVASAGLSVCSAP